MQLPLQVLPLRVRHLHDHVGLCLPLQLTALTARC
jgi:hypothetical protein